MHTRFSIKTSKAVTKFLKKHPDLHARYFKIIDSLSDNPQSPLVDIAKLQGEENCYRFRIGKYRFLYEIIDKEILIYVYDADSRGDIYK